MIRKMRTTIKLTCFFFVVVFISCNNPIYTNKGDKKQTDSLTNCDTILKGKKYITKQVPIYKVDTSLFPYLDTIVNLEKRCPYYKQCLSGFSFIISKTSDYYELNISTLNIYTCDYSACYGIFIYNGVRFICDGFKIDGLLYKTDESQYIRYLNINRKPTDIGPDDRYSSWSFEYKNEKLKLTVKHPCFSPFHGHDTTFTHRSF